MGGDAGWGFRVTMLMVTLGGIFIVGTLIGVLTTGIQGTIERLRKGRSFVMEDGHTLILGWSSKIHTIISELSIANENQKKPRVVVLADKDKVEMEDEIRDKTPNLRNTKVICRRGNPNDMTDLHIANPHEAKSIIILSPESESAGHASVNADSQTIKTILAITNNPDRRPEPYHIVAEMKHKKNLDVAKMVGKEEVELILSDDLTARIMVQTCRQSGLSGVYLELMDFDGAEIYFNEEKALVGKTFGESLAAYVDSAVMGLQLADGSVKVNPPMNTVIAPGDKVIAITEDDDTLIVSKEAGAVDQSVMKMPKRPAQRPERVLLLGWNHRAQTIIRELNNYVAPGSVVKVVANVKMAQEQVAAFAKGLKNLQFEFLTADTTSRPVLDKLEVSTYEHIILLCYEQTLSEQEADAQTLITLLHLRDIADKKGAQLNIVSEMLDMRNRELAEVTNVDDFIVGDKLISLLMSQVSENKHLMRVFEDLFDTDGSEIYLKPVTDFVQTGKPVNFYTVLESARRRDEIAIGYRINALARDPAKAYGVKVNPVKPEMVTFTPEDKIIVLAEN
jgi:voltage-gated potassium channel Kch